MFNLINTVCKYITQQQTFHSKIRGGGGGEKKKTKEPLIPGDLAVMTAPPQNIFNRKVCTPSS